LGGLCKDAEFGIIPWARPSGRIVIYGGVGVGVGERKSRGNVEVACNEIVQNSI